MQAFAGNARTLLQELDRSPPPAASVSQVLFFKGVNLRRLLLSQAFIVFIAQTLSEEIRFLYKTKANPPLYICSTEIVFYNS